jgi:dipeptidyl aminopeptidase/acylaminoacyl peptidase
MKPLAVLLALAAGAAGARAEVEVVAPHPRYVVYQASAPSIELIAELYRVDLKTGKIRELNLPPVTNGGTYEWLIDPKGRHVVFRGDLDEDGLLELYRSRIKNGKQLKLNGPADPAGYGVSHHFQADPRGRYAVYTAEEDSAGVIELYRTRLSDAKRLKLSGELVAGGDVDFDFVLDPLGRYALYFADQDVDGVRELYRSELKTGKVLRLSGDTAAAGGFFGLPRVDPKGKDAFYVADPEGDGARALFRTSLATGGPVQLSGDMVSGGNVTSWELRPAENGLLYRADQDVDEVFELYFTDFATGEATRLNQPLAPGHDVSGWACSTPWKSVLCQVEYEDLLVQVQLVRLDSGDVVPVTLPDGAIPYGIGLDPHERYGLFWIYAGPESLRELWRVDIADGSVLKLSGTPVDGGELQIHGYFGDLAITPEPSGRYVIYAADADTLDVPELYRSDLATGAVLKLNAPLPDGFELADYALDPTGRRALMFAVSEFSGESRLFSIELETGASVEVVAAPEQVNYHSKSVSFDPKGHFVIYEAHGESPGSAKLFRADLETGESVPITGPLQLNGGQGG